MSGKILFTYISILMLPLFRFILIYCTNRHARKIIVSCANSMIRSLSPVEVWFNLPQLLCAYLVSRFYYSNTYSLISELYKFMFNVCFKHIFIFSQLQMIKLLGVEPGKKGKTNLRFLVGNRITNTMQKMLERERVLNTLLK